MCDCHVVSGRSDPQAAEVDHIQPHRGDRALFFSLGNLQTLCKFCHSTAKQRMERGGRMQRDDGWAP
ncbi:HNH endonuclease signature motif containing protein [Martelella lutilitoris]|uniref:HNH endonuclease signature motif containing protein n=1 Tax=Martelella lutilitoris TaxID=2583532 RepID=UPI003D7C2673